MPIGKNVISTVLTLDYFLLISFNELLNVVVLVVLGYIYANPVVRVIPGLGYCSFIGSMDTFRKEHFDTFEKQYLNWVIFTL